MAKLKRILVVDDDKRLCALLREILTAAHYDVLDAEDGQQALDILSKESVDLLITDRSMPRLGGLELLQKLREQKNQIPALMISAYGEESLWAKAIGFGAEDYLLKPFSNDEVLKIVKKKLG
jgi:DNA-binding response OmpR family regulator